MRSEPGSALVTGGSAGIGLAVVRALAADGHRVTAVARDRDRLAAVTATLDGVTAHAADAADPVAVAAAVAAHVEREGGLDVAVANAGAGSAGRAATTTLDSIDVMLRHNLGAATALANAALPHLRRAAGRGWYVAVASISGMWPTAGFAGYSATKAAVVSLARSVAIEEAGAGVRACAICPAFVDTDMAAWVRDRIDGPLLDPADVGEAVRFLTRLSPGASVTELVLRRTGAAPTEP